MKINSYSKTEYLSEREGIGKPDTIQVIGTKANPSFVMFKCPCGEEDCLILISNKATGYGWDVKIDNEDKVTLSPSLSRKQCGAHFFIKDNQVQWCD